VYTPRKAGLKCVVIDGLVKANKYEPGDDTLQTTNWNAVHCEYGWQLVHPYWVCRALCGQKLTGWTKDEDAGSKGREPASGRDGF